MDRNKWRIRKQGGQWQVWRPREYQSVVQFDTFEQLLRWRPDCRRFLNGHCSCRNECAQ
ncbi:hypothetical protein BN970_03332 [Mycolicibacterium conceptionense]|uniref:Uncharacterized protein n=1 Tax=Mycolicibacterium conceptionense TaxID=451644 RepID=A0A0U1DGN4_9MYCO|nr:hypothetical protein BN970_03332 [Mycolicibacterium conceptionense]